MRRLEVRQIPKCDISVMAYDMFKVWSLLSIWFTSLRIHRSLVKIDETNSLPLSLENIFVVKLF
jgi:hypothetical protein